LQHFVLNSSTTAPAMSALPTPVRGLSQEQLDEISRPRRRRGQAGASRADGAADEGDLDDARSPMSDYGSQLLHQKKVAQKKTRTCPVTGQQGDVCARSTCPMAPSSSLAPSLSTVLVAVVFMLLGLVLGLWIKGPTKL
jgi:hypothetical protein